MSNTVSLFSTRTGWRSVTTVPVFPSFIPFSRHSFFSKIHFEKTEKKKINRTPIWAEECIRYEKRRLRRRLEQKKTKENNHNPAQPRWLNAISKAFPDLSDILRCLPSCSFCIFDEHGVHGHYEDIPPSFLMPCKNTRRIKSNEKLVFRVFHSTINSSELNVARDRGENS